MVAAGGGEIALLTSTMLCEIQKITAIRFQRVGRMTTLGTHHVQKRFDQPAVLIRATQRLRTAHGPAPAPARGRSRKASVASALAASWMPAVCNARTKRT